MNKKELLKLIIKKRSFLCIGLDSDIDLIPQHLLRFPDPVFEFNKQIIDATIDVAIGYKPNVAFYESRGSQGWASLEKTIKYLNQFKGNVFTIADAKRGDIGNTSKMYAKAFFEHMDFDAVTVAPYMGEDSVRPFLEYKDKWVLLLGLNSNESSKDFQLLQTPDGKLYEQVISKAQQWAGPDQLMFVAGATHPEQFKDIRKLAPDYFYLVPGVGAQGGDMAKICENGLTRQCGLIVNSARNIIYAGKGEDFAIAARNSALKTVDEMTGYIAGFSKE